MRVHSNPELGFTFEQVKSGVLEVFGCAQPYITELALVFFQSCPTKLCQGNLPLLCQSGRTVSPRIACRIPFFICQSTLQMIETNVTRACMGIWTSMCRYLRFRGGLPKPQVS